MMDRCRGISTHILSSHPSSLPIPVPSIPLHYCHIFSNDQPFDSSGWVSGYGQLKHSPNDKPQPQSPTNKRTCPGNNSSPNVGDYYFRFLPKNWFIYHDYHFVTLKLLLLSFLFPLPPFLALEMRYLVFPPLPAFHFPLPTSHFPLPASRFPLPASRSSPLPHSPRPASRFPAPALRRYKSVNPSPFYTKKEKD